MKNTKKKTNSFSTHIGFRKYPALRDDHPKTATTWIRGRVLDEDFEPNYWRIHDKLYDFSDFIEKHPGGAEWLEATRGMDITENFESSHLNPTVYDILSKYYRKPAGNKRRNSPYTFEPNGFYMTLKKRVSQFIQKQMTAEERRAGRMESESIQNRFLATFLALFALTLLTGSSWAAAAAGAALMLCVNCTHNFYHQRDCWRIRVTDLSLLSSYEWRVTHAISHHAFPNTIYDFESSVTEPFLDVQVREKSFLRRWISCLAVFIAPPFFCWMDAMKRIIVIAKGYQKPRLVNLFPIIELAILYLSSDGFFHALELWLIMHTTCSVCIVLLGLLASHHRHPNLYHMGDGEFPYGRDWGACQLDAVKGRKIIDDGDLYLQLPLQLITYGNHILHHMFPTLDHSLLEKIRPIFKQTCAEFGLPEELYSNYGVEEMAMGIFRQLHRISPREPRSNSQG